MHTMEGYCREYRTMAVNLFKYMISNTEILFGEQDEGDYYIFLIKKKI